MLLNACPGMKKTIPLFLLHRMISRRVLIGASLCLFLMLMVVCLENFQPAFIHFDGYYSMTNTKDFSRSNKTSLIFLATRNEIPHRLNQNNESDAYKIDNPLGIKTIETKNNKSRALDKNDTNVFETGRNNLSLSDQTKYDVKVIENNLDTSRDLQKDDAKVPHVQKSASGDFVKHDTNVIDKKHDASQDHAKQDTKVVDDQQKKSHDLPNPSHDIKPLALDSNLPKKPQSSLSKNSNSSHIKSEAWFLAAMTHLPSKFVTPSSILLEHSYFHPPHRKVFEILEGSIISPSQCSDKTKLLAVILSQPTDFSTRRVIRETWGSVVTRKSWPWVDFGMVIKLVFVLGVKEHSWCTDDGRPIVGKPGVMRNNTSEIFSKLEEESATFNDVLLLCTRDSYANLTRKVILSLKWSVNNCPFVQYIIKVDQDIFVNVPLLWQFLKHKGSTNSIFGHIYVNQANVQRRGKWALSKSAVPVDKFPVYASGNCYILSYDAALKVLDNYFRFRYVSIEDAFITGIVASVAKINRYSVAGFTKWTDTIKHPCEFVMDRTFTTNRVNESSMRTIWNEIDGRGHGWCK